MSGAAFHTGKSRQDFETPKEFIEAMVKRFGPIAFDLAASDNNFKGPSDCWFSEQNDSLSMPWHDIPGLLFLNPPFRDIEPWAAKCAREAVMRANILFLIPASVGSNWFANHVHNKAARVMFLRPRLSFDGIAPFPKDIILVYYSDPLAFKDTAYECWKWK